jgi:hypothetical protein
MSSYWDTLSTSAEHCESCGDDIIEDWEHPEWDCQCSRCNALVPVEERCLCPADIIVNNEGTRKWHGTVSGHTDGCPIHKLPGCPNPECGETWVKAFRWPKCDACGWTAPIIEEEPTTLDLST